MSERVGNLSRKIKTIKKEPDATSRTEKYIQFSSVQLLSRVQLFATPWIAAHQASLSITNSQSSLTHVHRVSDAIQPSHPLSSPSPPAPNPSQHQSLFQWINSSHEVAKVLEFQLQHHSFQRNPGADLLQNGLVGSKIYCMIILKFLSTYCTKYSKKSDNISSYQYR